MTEPNQHIDDDKSSVSSHSSVTHQPICCPFCDWSKKQRYLFNHIMSNHYEKISSHIGTSSIIKTDLEQGQLLRLYISTYSPDDEFKEFDKTPKVIYGCLGDGCNNTYEQPGRAKAHWKNSKKCHQSHIKKVKAELKKVEDEEAKRDGRDWKKDLSQKDLIFLLEKNRRWYYRFVVEDYPFLKSQPFNQGVELANKYLEYEFKDPSEYKNRIEMMDTLDSQLKLLTNLNILVGKRFTFPYDWKLPLFGELSESFEEAGLLPVGSSYDEYANKRLAASSKYLQQQQQDKETISLLEQEKLNLLKELKKAQEAPKQEAAKPEASKPEAPKLETISEVPKKEKRNSFTIPVPTPGSLVNQPIQTASFPTILSNTKVKRTPKTVS